MHDTKLEDPNWHEGAHSRACGINKHEHGIQCHRNCPTCHGGNPDVPQPSEAPRVAKLEVKAASTNVAALSRGMHFIGLKASNGEPLMTSEMHPNKWAADRSEEAILRAMIEVLESRGYTVEDGRL